jgi:hypothetical protein
VNGPLIPKDELATKLKEEFSKRMVWTVYFEADDASNFGNTTYSIDTIQGLGAKVFWITPQVRKELNDEQAAILPHRGPAQKRGAECSSGGREITTIIRCPVAWRSLPRQLASESPGTHPAPVLPYGPAPRRFPRRQLGALRLPPVPKYS